MKSNKTAIVCGNARSGTSMVSAILDSIGVDMNGNRIQTKMVPTGNWEDARISYLTLNLVSGKMKESVVRQQLLNHIKRRDVKPLWGFKCTEFVKIPDIILDIIPNPFLVVVFRDLLSNAESLITNQHFMANKTLSGDGGKEVQMYELGKRNFELITLLKSYNKIPKFYTSYERVKKDPVSEGKKLCGFLGISFKNEMKNLINNRIVKNYTTLK